jgi:adenylate cyclase
MSGMPEPAASSLNERSSRGRKLIAVAYADMVGYSRLIELDDIGTLERLRSLRSALIEPAIAEYGGKIVQTGGDSMLIVFDSIDGAVRCALKLQQEIPTHDGEQDRDRTIRYRIGINIGDVIADGTDLHGDTVNVAARLQTECPPGEVCVTRAVRDHIQDRFDLAFHPLGTLDLKNISRPVEAFVVAFDQEPTARKPQGPSRQAESLPLPDRPSVAVLAFANMSGDPSQEFLSDGIAEGIIGELSRNRSLFVIARTSSFSYKRRSIAIKQVARELGVRYVIEGSVRRAGKQIRVAAQLIDAESGSHIWAERFERELADLFSVQDEISRSMAAAIDPAISQVEGQRAMRKPPENLSAWEAWQRALWHWSKGGDVSARRDFLLRTVALDPLFAPAHAMLVWLHLSEGTRGVGPPLPESEKLAEAEARTALDLDPYSAFAHAALAWVLYHQGDCRAALEEAEIATTLNPNDPQGHLIKGHILVMSGSRIEAREPLATALRLDPRGPTAPAVMHNRIVGAYLDRDYGAAEEAARRAIRAYPEHPSIARPYLWLAAALGQMLQPDQARSALDAAITASRSYFDYKTGSRARYVRPEDHEHLLQGLRRAGWQG